MAKAVLLTLLGTGAAALALPGAGPGPTIRPLPDLTALLTPEPVSSVEFSAFYAPHRG
ncbi:MAG TPA: hypothetical protein VHA07_02925 [Devosia sp.]|nr:hypothetical protein [Devosia sp.]